MKHTMKFLRKQRRREEVRLFYKKKWITKKIMNKLLKETNMFGVRWNDYWQGSKQRKIVWELTKKDFAELWQKPCSYCGSNIETIGIDRIDSSKGYIKSNCVPCCAICNKMKTNRNKEEFINHCKLIVLNI